MYSVGVGGGAERNRLPEVTRHGYSDNQRIRLRFENGWPDGYRKTVDGNGTPTAALKMLFRFRVVRGAVAVAIGVAVTYVAVDS